MTSNLPRLFCLFPSLAIVLLLTSAGYAQKTDAMGSVRASQISCPDNGLAGSACYALEVTCPQIANYTVYLKTIAPSDPPVGVVTLTQGGTSTDLYENYAFGSVTIHDLVSPDSSQSRSR